MRCRRKGALGTRIIGLAVLVAVSGGCLNRGVVLRGDWSLELNHIAPLESQGAVYSDDGSCAGCSNGSCARRPGGSGVGAGLSPDSAGYYRDPRFRTVPTRPVFGPHDGPAGRPALGPPAPTRPFAPDGDMPPEPEQLPMPDEIAPPVDDLPGNDQAGYNASQRYDSERMRSDSPRRAPRRVERPIRFRRDGRHRKPPRY